MKTLIGKVRRVRKGEILKERMALFSILNPIDGSGIFGVGRRTYDPEEHFGWSWNAPGYKVTDNMLGLYLAPEIEAWGDEELCP